MDLPHLHAIAGERLVVDSRDMPVPEYPGPWFATAIYDSDIGMFISEVDRLLAGSTSRPQGSQDVSPCLCLFPRG